VQEFFDIPGSPTNLGLSTEQKAAPGRGKTMTPNMQIDAVACWSEHDYPHMSEHANNTITVEVRTACSAVIDKVHVTGYLWRWQFAQWNLVASQPKDAWAWYRAVANPGLTCPGGQEGFYYTSSGYHQMWWAGQTDWGNSWSDKTSWIRCGGPY
jgi:hypothetical protein